MIERIYSDGNTLVEFNSVRNSITVETSGCGDSFSFYYWNLSKVSRLFSRRLIQGREINHGEDFKSLIYHNHLKLSTMSKFINTVSPIIKKYMKERELLVDKKDFEYSNLKDKPIGLLKYLCEKHKIKL